MITSTNNNSGKRESSTARGKKKSQNKRGKRGGRGFATKKPADKFQQCLSVRKCNLANAQLWPEESERSADWLKALRNYKQYCKENKVFCERSATTFKNPAASEVWKQRRGSTIKGEERFAGNLRPHGQCVAPLPGPPLALAVRQLRQLSHHQ